MASQFSKLNLVIAISRAKHSHQITRGIAKKLMAAHDHADIQMSRVGRFDAFATHMKAGVVTSVSVAEV